MMLDDVRFALLGLPTNLAAMLGQRQLPDHSYSFPPSRRVSTTTRTPSLRADHAGSCRPRPLRLLGSRPRYAPTAGPAVPLADGSTTTMVGLGEYRGTSRAGSLSHLQALAFQRFV